MPSPEDLYPIATTDRIMNQLRGANWLTGVMVTILRQYFGSDDRIMLEKGQFKWVASQTDPDVSANIAQSGVQIDVVDNLKHDEGNKFPKMLVDLETREFPRDAVGDLGNYDNIGGTVEFTNRVQGVFGIECWAPFKLEAHSMADEIYYFLQAFRKQIMDKYCFATLRIRQIVKPAKYKVFKDYWIARVIIEFETEERWGTTQEALRVSSFGLHLNNSEPPLQP